MTITEFLTARYDEDERFTYNPALMPVSGPGLSDLVKRARADIAAKRAIVAAAVETLAVEEVGFPADEHGLSEARSLAEFTIRTFAQVFAEHPDFDPAWRTNGG